LCNPIEHFRWHPNVTRAKSLLQVNTNHLHRSSACARLDLLVGSALRLATHLDVSPEQCAEAAEILVDIVSGSPI